MRTFCAMSNSSKIHRAKQGRPNDRNDLLIQICFRGGDIKSEFQNMKDEILNLQKVLKSNHSIMRSSSPVD